MELNFLCPVCNTERTAVGAAGGGQLRCPTCDNLIEMPPQWWAERGVDEAPETAALPVPLEEIIEEARLIPMDPPAAAVEVGPWQQSPSLPHSTPPAIEEWMHEEETVPTRSMNRDDTDMDMTPMVDVVFQLLIFFMLTAAFALQKAIEVPKPEEQSDQPSTVQMTTDIMDNPEFVTIKVDAFNTYRVITVDWDEEAPSEQEMLVKLRKAKNGDSAGRIPNKLIVQANEESLHEKVVAALDGGMAVKMEEIQLMTVTEDD